MRQREFITPHGRSWPVRGLTIARTPPRADRLVGLDHRDEPSVDGHPLLSVAEH